VDIRIAIHETDNTMLELMLTPMFVSGNSIKDA